jgi:hypothetical protein
MFMAQIDSERSTRARASGTPGSMPKRADSLLAYTNRLLYLISEEVEAGSHTAGRRGPESRYIS